MLSACLHCLSSWQRKQKSFGPAWKQFLQPLQSSQEVLVLEHQSPSSLASASDLLLMVLLVQVLSSLVSSWFCQVSFLLSL